MDTCPCGRKLETTSTDPYVVKVVDDKGNFISGTCIHGVRFGKDADDNFKPKRYIQLCHSCLNYCIDVQESVGDCIVNEDVHSQLLCERYVKKNL